MNILFPMHIIQIIQFDPFYHPNASKSGLNSISAKKASWLLKLDLYLLFSQNKRLRLIHSEMSETSHTESTSLSSGVYIAVFLILFAILAVFGDLFTFVLGTIGLVVTFAAFYRDKGHDADHH